MACSQVWLPPCSQLLVPCSTFLSELKTKERSVVCHNASLAYVLTMHKPVRYHLDAWEEMMMDRDKRLTGHERGQSVCIRRIIITFDLLSGFQTESIAPESFATNSKWYTQRA
jgi:hypothetical protein